VFCKEKRLGESNVKSLWKVNKRILWYEVENDSLRSQNAICSISFGIGLPVHKYTASAVKCGDAICPDCTHPQHTQMKHSSHAPIQKDEKCTDQEVKKDP
jgi:hypothetical protein